MAWHIQDPEEFALDYFRTFHGHTNGVVCLEEMHVAQLPVLENDTKGSLNPDSKIGGKAAPGLLE